MPKTKNADTTTLDNGLRLLLHANDASPSVAIIVMVGVGSRYENPQQNGIAHFLEHMTFKGTERRPTTLDISTEVDGVGGESNAFTSKEYTGYYIKVASGQLPLAVDLLEDMLFHSTYQPQEVDRERGVIIEEINMYHDSPRDVVGEMYEQLLYPRQPLGAEITGTPQTLKKIGSGQLRSFVEEWYVPNNIIVGIAGSFDAEEARYLIDRSFGQLQSHKLSGYQPAAAEQTDPQVVIQHKQTDQTQLIVGLRSFSVTDPRRYPLALLNVALGGNMSSRLFTQVREKRGLAYAVHSGVEDYLDVGSLSCSAGLGHKNAVPALQVILEQLVDIREHGISEQELSRAKQYLAGRLSLSMEDSLGVAMFYSRQWLLENEIRTIDQTLERLNAVDIDQVKEVAQQIIQPQNLNLAAIGPQLDESALKKALRL